MDISPRTIYQQTISTQNDSQYLRYHDTLKYIFFGLCPQFLAQEFLESLQFRSVFCFNEASLNGSLDSFRMEAGPQKSQTLTRSLELSASSPNSRDGRESGDRGNKSSCLHDELPKKA